MLDDIVFWYIIFTPIILLIVCIIIKIKKSFKLVWWKINLILSALYSLFFCFNFTLLMIFEVHEMNILRKERYEKMQIIEYFIPAPIIDGLYLGISFFPKIFFTIFVISLVIFLFIDFIKCIVKNAKGKNTAPNKR